AKTLADKINSADCVHGTNFTETIRLDIHSNLVDVLAQVKPNVVVHTSGPFQQQGYEVALACIEHACHYIDLADGRDFVAGICTLHDAAKANGVLVISGASSVPCLTAALLDDYHAKFGQLETIDYGITTAQQTARGLATSAAILGYTGKAFETLVDGQATKVYGWQKLRTRRFKQLGRRLLGSCDVPDLALFPTRYPQLKTIQFCAGLEIPLIHFTLWMLSWLVRARLISSLRPLAPLMLWIASLFDWMGTSSSGFFLELSGKDRNGADKKSTFELTARDGDGAYIPCIPAILLVNKLASAQRNGTAFGTSSGAYPCVGFISKDEYLAALRDLHISWEHW
ncbi:MAG: hypothetical protein ACI8W7_005012, partial [Gammaproteobacteria bacterium]